MGLLDNTNQQQYYQGNDHGNYQFTSLDNIITQFEIAYVGENKIIPKINRADIVFHAQRSLQELSFDTLKSCKSQEIVVPASLKMILPQDYVNYTKVSWVDSAGIKHPLYYTHDTSNPFTVAQHDDGTYVFSSGFGEEVINGDFSSSLDPDWITGAPINIDNPAWANYNLFVADANGNIFLGNVTTTNNKLTFQHQAASALMTGLLSTISHVYQELDVSDKSNITLTAEGQAVNTAGGHAGILRVGLSTSPPNINSAYAPGTAWANTANSGNDNAELMMWDLVDDDGNASYLEWTVAGDNTLTKSTANINVDDIDTLYVIVISYHDFSTEEFNLGLQDTNNIDNISVFNTGSTTNLSSPSNNIVNSLTWNNYQSHTLSENNINDYQDYQNDIYWPNEGRRYGLDPQRAQVNGSFYIDCRLGKIHFSSNISGRTVILDYISDSLGTDKEMQVHKFAEEAMYKSIAHAILSTSSYGQALIPRLTKEKFAAIRKAKLRLSNLKLEELIQILRGKSKQIKH